MQGDQSHATQLHNFTWTETFLHSGQHNRMWSVLPLAAAVSLADHQTLHNASVVLPTRNQTCHRCTKYITTKILQRMNLIVILTDNMYTVVTHTHTHAHTHTHIRTQTHTHSLWSSLQTIIVSRIYTPVHHHQRSYFSPTNIPHWKLYTGTYQCRTDWQRCWLSAVSERWSMIHQSSWTSGQCWLQSKWHDDQTVLLKTKWKCEHNYRSHFKCFLSTHTKRLSIYKCMSTNKKSAKSPFTGNLCTISKSICTINKTCNSMQCKAATTRLV